MPGLRKLLSTTAAIVTLAVTANVAAAGPLENLERERALLVEALFDPSLGPGDRQAKVEIAKARLVDLERIVLRDDGIVGRNTPTVRRAFANYDLTFLVHASLENNRAIVDTWLGEVGVSTAALMAARQGRR